ncbi:diacylglycerol kinase family lipid kinase [Actinocorallia sp. API 0066]|uniref:diacylglycerol/lipid kinase family protein n=1 Tax=Actinocorallia sp. API 0066 TaxID=2896846 RepID=UPI001E4C1586|nr:diacylglycerol kinase family protein [Actinocorallia sp. API 0066]MCD0448170.1 diacylglycerol kinase family lipid kinase [Actinocorallia sp. API 0066]
MLIANPKASSTTRQVRDLLIRAFGGHIEVDLAETGHRGHAIELAERAAREGYDVLIALGGDGTVNEAVNGLMAVPGTAETRPALAILPGGNANVFGRALGLPNDPMRSLAAVLGALRTGHTRTIGLGHVTTAQEERYYTFTVGVGLDAEVVKAVEEARSKGSGKASNALYVRCALRQFFTATNRSRPALEARANGRVARGLFLAFVSNTSPYTYLGPRPILPSPRASLGAGLDLFAIRTLRAVPVLAALAQMFVPAAAGPRGRHIVELHSAEKLSLTAFRPIAMQVDGEYVGEREHMEFRSVPAALRVVI